MEEDWVREHSGKLDVGLDGMHIQVLKEMTDTIVRPLAIIFC